MAKSLACPHCKAALDPALARSAGSFRCPQCGKGIKTARRSPVDFTPLPVRSKTTENPLPVAALLEEDVEPPPEKNRTPWIIGAGVLLLALGIGIGLLIVKALSSPTEATESGEKKGTPAPQQQAPENELNAVVAAADRLDPGWRVEELEARRESLADPQNAAMDVLAARKLLPNPWNYKGIEKLLGELGPTDQLNRRQNLLLKNELQRHARALDAARRIIDKPNGRYPLVLPALPHGMALPHIECMREVAQLLAYDYQFRAQSNDLDGALISARGIVNVGRSIGDELPQRSQVARQAIVYMGVLGMERVLSQGQPYERELKNAQIALRKEAEYQPLLTIARGERAFFHQTMATVQKGSLRWEDVMKSVKGPPQLNGLSKETIEAGHAPGLAWLNDFVEAAKLPSTQQDELLNKLIARADGVPPAGKVLLPDVNKFVEICRTNEAVELCGAVGLAVERFRLERKRWPQDLAEVKEAQLVSEIPLDPFDGQPLRFRKDAQGAVVYSVGPDKEDNGGSFVTLNSHQPGSDLGFRLYEVSKRRALVK